MRLNVNDTVWVKLSPHGERILSPYQLRRAERRGPWMSFQLWELIKTFAPHLTMGGPLLFATEILVGEEPPREGESADV